MKVGLYAESSNDTRAIINLLSRTFPKVIFIDLLRGKTTESIADNINKTSRVIKARISVKDTFHVVILIRDLDAPATAADKIKSRHEWFKMIDKAIDNKGLFLLNIEELEALVLADIGTFNTYYNTTVKYSGNPMFHPNPKEALIGYTKNKPNTYKEEHAPALFAQLDYSKLLKVKYFNDFHVELSKIVIKKKRK